MAQHGDAHARNTLPNTTTQTVQEGTRSTPATSAPVTISVVLRPRKKVSWNEDTVDNEHLQKKSSKICCIYHKKETLEDSSDDEDDCGSAGKGKRPCPHRGSDFAESSEKRNE